MLPNENPTLLELRNEPRSVLRERLVRRTELFLDAYDSAPQEARTVLAKYLKVEKLEELRELVTAINKKAEADDSTNFTPPL